MSDLPTQVSSLVTQQAPGSPAVALSGHRLIWHQAEWQGHLEVAQHSFGSLHLAAISTGESVPQPKSLAMALLNGAGATPGCAAVELRYLLTPGGGNEHRVDLFITVKAYEDNGGGVVVDAALAAVESALPREFRTQRIRTPPPDAWPTVAQSVVEIRRNEIVIEPVYEYVPADFFYFVEHPGGDGSGWAKFWEAAPAVARPIELSLLFMPTSLSFEEQVVSSAVVSDLQRFSEAHIEPDMLGNDVHYPADANARIAYESWEQLIRKLQNGCFLARTALRGDLDDIVPLGTQLMTALAASEEGPAQQGLYLEFPSDLSEHRSASESFEWLEIYPWGGAGLWLKENADVAPHSLRRFPYLHGLEDAAGLAMLPVPDERGAPGFTVGRRNQSRRTMRSSASISVPLGSSLHHGEAGRSAGLSLDDVNRHVGVTGSPGSGKTTTVLSLLVGLWRDHAVPFMVIEPTKREYRSLLGASGMEDLMVIPVGREDICSLRINPLEPPPGVRCENYVSSLMATLKLALPLFPPLPQLLEEALHLTYSAAGWGYDSTLEDGFAAPSIRDLIRNFNLVFEGANYVGEASNLGAALRVRLSSLTRGSKGRLLDTLESDDFNELMTRPVVIELEDIADPEDKAVIAAILLDRIRSAANLRTERASLKHVTVLEEAHRLLANSSASSEQTNHSQQGAVEAFCNAIAELRSTGEGFVISTQSPSRLAEAALANVGTRIVHRMENAKDREAMLGDLDLVDDDKPLFARLGRGEAFIRTPAMDDADLVKVEPPASVDSGRVVPNEAVVEAMTHFSARSRRRLPYPLCTTSVCFDGCSSDRRRHGESAALRIGASASRAWNSAQSGAGAIADTISIVRRDGEEAVAQQYCIAAHLQANGQAFESADPKEMGQTISNQLRSESEGEQSDVS